MRSDLPAHAKYGPSSMGRIIKCPGSVQLQAKAPPQAASVYAEEGTRAHALAEALLLMDDDAIDAALAACREAGDDIGEVEACTNIYAAHCNPLLDDASKYGIEAKLVLDDELFGTADMYALVGRTLHVVDYKHGAGVVVSPEENMQGLTYAALVLADPDVSISEEDVDTVVITIVQPRGQGFPVQQWGAPVSRVKEHMDAVDDAIAKAERDDAPTAMGEHCRFCTAKLICPSQTKARAGVAEWDGRDLPPEELSRRLGELKALEGYIKDLKSYAESRLDAGETIPGWKRVAGRKTRAWGDEEKLLKWARKQGVLTKLFEKRLLSPAAASKVIPGEELTRFITTRETKPVLKQVSEPGEPLESPMAALAALGQRSTT